MRLTNGYYIAPADLKGENITGINGILPFFTSVQGNQKFNVYDPTGQAVGSFDGVFTTTSDIINTYTQAILVTGSDGAEQAYRQSARCTTSSTPVLTTTMFFTRRCPAAW